MRFSPLVLNTYSSSLNSAATIIIVQPPTFLWLPPCQSLHQCNPNFHPNNSLSTLYPLNHSKETINLLTFNHHSETPAAYFFQFATKLHCSPTICKTLNNYTFHINLKPYISQFNKPHPSSSQNKQRHIPQK